MGTGVSLRLAHFSEMSAKLHIQPESVRFTFAVKPTHNSMIEINLHEVIDEKSNAWIYDWLGMDAPFSLETLQAVLSDNRDNDDAIRLNIHCDGGNVMEGLAIYDALRTSGRNIFCNVEGKCHSMAITLLLAAPKGQRSAQPNSQFLIHEVSGGVSGNTTAVERYAEEMRDLQDRILDIYADRTGWDRKELSDIMSEEKFRDAQFMLDHGFISSINAYNTNSNNMGLLNELKNLISKAEKEVDEQNAAQNADQQSELAEKLAEAEKNLSEANGTITNLNAERETMQNSITEKDARIAELEGQLAEANAKCEASAATISDMTEQMNAKDTEIADLKKQVGSSFQPAERESAASSEHKSAQASREEEKEAIREALRKKK